MNHPAGNRAAAFRWQTGITLVELVIVMAIAGLLMSLATPSYRQYMQRSQRVQAISGLLGAAACQERIRAESGSYDQSECLPRDSEEYRYGYVGDARGGASFTIQATPLGSQENDACGSLFLSQTGEQDIGGEDLQAHQCWLGR